MVFVRKLNPLIIPTKISRMLINLVIEVSEENNGLQISVEQHYRTLDTCLRKDGGHLEKNIF